MVSESDWAHLRARCCRRGGISSVAGVEAPAFVERDGQSVRRTDHGGVKTVSPGWKPRPSLSVSTDIARLYCGSAIRVAGVEAPAFVERRVGPAYACRRSMPVRVAGVEAPAFVERS